jgi:ParB family chromosome partitioning protein
MPHEPSADRHDPEVARTHTNDSTTDTQETQVMTAKHTSPDETPEAGTPTTAIKPKPDLGEHDEIPIASIVVGPRARKSVGKLDALVDSIRADGLFHGLLIDSQNQLIAGYRRLLALKKLGRTHAPVHRLATLDDAVAALRAERDENLCCKDLTLSEKAALGKRLEALEKPKAKKRQATAGPRSGRGSKPSGPGKMPEAEKGEVRAKWRGPSTSRPGRTANSAKSPTRPRRTPRRTAT